MQTVFIALQCCQCFTMQVKQRKKSSNKWVCVVCNQKQSVRNVFAEGFMAKDVRKFVQSFNMSRHIADQQIDLDEQEEPQTLISEDQFNGNTISNNKKRTDWSEYLDLEDESVEEQDQETTGMYGMETRIVTELPKAVFKRPKLSNCFADSESRFKPVFTKRNARKQNPSQDKDIGIMAKMAPLEGEEAPWCGSKSTQVAKSNESFVKGDGSRDEIRSKWSEYLTVEEDDGY